VPPRENVTVVGTVADHRLRDFLTRVDQPYEWFDEDNGREFLERHGAVDAGLPVVVVDDEIVLVQPTLEEVADALGIRYPPRSTEYDVVIVGAGPAGLAAAVYAASDGLSVAVPEREAPGGQAAHTSRIENYFGIDPLGPPMTGAHLARIGGRQAEMFGAELLILRGAVGSRLLDDGRHEIELTAGERLRALALVCASGVAWRRLDVSGIDRLFGRGVYFGAGRSEAPLLRGKKVVVVGGGNSAGQAALHLADYADRVTMVCRGPSLAASLSAYLLERIRANPRIEVRLHSRVTGVDGDPELEAVTINGTERLPADALFVAIGGTPQTDWVAAHQLRRDEAGYVLTGPDLGDGVRTPTGWPLQRAPYALEASVPGVFVAGDVRHGSTKRVAAAVGEGSTAVAQIHTYLNEQREVG
jgi:thioredoxin reductase (NADPH)